MANNSFAELLMFVAYLAVDFLMFKYFIYNKKGLIQMLIQKKKSKTESLF